MSNLGDLNPVAELAGSIRESGKFYANDLRALPATAYGTSFAEKARSPQSFTTEVVVINRMVAAQLRGEEFPWPDPEAYAEIEGSMSSPDAGVAALLSSSDELAAAVEANPSRLADKTMAPWNVEVTFWYMANLSASHMMYHDGQLTYLQSIHGDDKMHWFDA